MQRPGWDQPPRRGDVVQAPPSRYRVIEKDGRLIVLDSGRPVGSGPTPPSQASRIGGAGAAGGGWLAMADRWAVSLANRFAERREPDGRLILRAKAGGKRTVLSASQAIGYGRALLGLAIGILLLFPVNILLGIVGGEGGALLSGFATMIGFVLALGGGASMLVIRALGTAGPDR